MSGRASLFPFLALSFFWGSLAFTLILTAILVAWIWLTERFIWRPIHRALDRWYERRIAEIKKGE